MHAYVATLWSIASDFVCPTNRDCSVPPPTSGESVACYECQVGCGCANDLISSAASTILCGALPIKVDNNLCGAVVGEAIAGAMSGTPQSCDNVCNKQCTARDGGTPDSPEGDASTCISGGAADLENPVGAYVFEFIGSDSATISGGGGYQADYDLLVGADLQSNFAGLESYTVRSAALRVDVAYSSTPLCTDSNTGQTVKCDYPLAECITGTFVTDDFDLTGALLIHEAPGAASNPLRMTSMRLSLRWRAPSLFRRQGVRFCSMRVAKNCSSVLLATRRIMRLAISIPIWSSLPICSTRDFARRANPRASFHYRTGRWGWALT